MLQQRTRAREEYVIVLDFLQHGYAEDSRPLHRKEAIVQAIGKSFFTLLELVPAEGVKLKPHDEVYIGEGKRDQISYIKGTLFFSKLTPTAKTELNFILDKIVSANETKFIDFINKSGPISLRAHSLELLPGVGKKHAQDLLKEREKAPFASFDDIKNRVSSVSEPKRLVIQRILDELEGKDRYRLFVRV